jgi:MOSC domain-containing protein YiiM
MQEAASSGKVVSLHLHPPVSGDPFLSVGEVRAEAGQGIVGDARFFGRKNRQGEPSRRQVSLISRELLAEHAAAHGLRVIEPGAVRANIETAGIDLGRLVGSQVKVGGAVLFFYEARTPCEKMERIAPGLCKSMAHGRQGVMAEVIVSGEIRVGDRVHPVKV